MTDQFGNRRDGMTSSHEPPDPYNLSRFVEAQEDDYEQAISELRSGKKRTHWIGTSFRKSTDWRSARSPSTMQSRVSRRPRRTCIIRTSDRGCLNAPDAVFHIEGRSAAEIFSSPDDLKLKSCATLFACVSPPGSVFERLLGGE